MADAAATRYQVERRLAVGGMAEIYLARQITPGGLERPVVLKRVLRHLTSDERFMSMFLDEARLALQLAHPNVVRLLDVGHDDEGTFLVMEHLRGRDVAAVQGSLARRNQRPPTSVVAQIAVDAARGLDHAHRRRDPSGRLTPIVHRDVSPSNLFITFDGFTKVLDFGIAKARTRFEWTEPGVLKGKYGYMAPELVAGATATPESDQFGLGVVLHELITGEPLFHRDTQVATLRAIEELAIPPLECPLGEAIARMLAREPGDRFASCAAAAEAIEAARSGPGGPEPVARWLLELFPDGADPETDQPEGTNATALIGSLVPAPASPPPEHGFVGRGADLRLLGQLVGERRRLVTVLGPGGIGKTRLVKRMVDSERFRGRDAVFCDATEVRSLPGLCHAVGRALGLDLLGDPDQALVQLGRAMQDRSPLLLVLDNVEQVTRLAADAIAAWLAAGDQLQVLVTSREVLGLPEEVVHELAPLALPERDEQVDQSEAGRLFLDRARHARPGWRLADGERVAIAEIVRRLEGMPLAIELAAARMAVLAPAQLLRRLEDRFRILSGVREGVPARQAALQSTIDWSWDLLSEPERSALAQASVFRGGFLAESAEEIILLPDGPPVLDLLQSLRHKSLLTSREGGAELRLAMYESIREYAWQRLSERGEAAGALDRHAAYYLGFGEALVAGLAGHGGVECLARLDDERENVASVHQRALDSGASERAVRSAIIASALFEIRGPSVANIAFLDSALAVAGRAPIGLQWRAQIRLARGRRNGPGASAAATGLEAILPAVRAAGDVRAEGELLATLGFLCDTVGRPDDARRYLIEARAHHARHGQGDLEPETLRLLGGAYLGEDNERAVAIIEEAVAASRRTGNVRVESRSALYLGMARLGQRRLEEATALFEQALALNREVRDLGTEGSCHLHLGILYQELGLLVRAEASLRATDEVARRIGNERVVAGSVRHLAQLAWEMGRVDEALAGFEESARIARGAGDRPGLAWAEVHAAALQAARGDLDRARRTHADAVARFEETRDAQGMAAAEFSRGHLLLAEAATIADPAAAARLRQEASALPVAPRGAESDDVRFAERMLRAAISE